jgi:hypothetical protein
MERYEFEKCVSELSFILEFEFDDPTNAARLLRRAMIMVCWGEPTEANFQALIDMFFPFDLPIMSAMLA